jgi:general secretion pathway protein D
MKMNQILLRRVIVSAGICVLGNPVSKGSETAVDESSAAARAGVAALMVRTSGSDRLEAGLQLNFRGAPLDLLLDYLSDAGGFVINKQAEVHGTFDVWSKDRVSKGEAVELLNSALKKNGYAVVRQGRVLTIVTAEAARHQDSEVSSGSDPNAIARSDEVATQIIPVRYANASQLINNLQPLLPATATLSVNESASSLILVAAKTDIRRMLKIVNALDSSLASVSTIKVIALRYADAKQISSVVQQLFATQATGQTSSGQSRNPFLNLPGGEPSAFGGTSALPPSSGTGGTALAATKVVATADEQSNSLILSAPAPAIATITSLVKQLDQPMTGLTELRIFNLQNADPSELAEQLAQLFPEENKSGENDLETPFRFGGPPPFGGPGGNVPSAASGDEQSGESERSKKKSKVLAVPDPRTSSLLVSAASTLMPQIAKLVTELDRSAGQKELVKVFEIQNANPQAVNQVLADLFNKNGGARNSGQGSLLGQNNPLTARQTQQQNSASTTGSQRSGSPGGAASGLQ